MGAPIRVLLVDDRALLRGAIATILADQPGFEVVGQAENGLRGVEMAHELRPDIVLLDIDMPVMDGLQAAELLRSSLPEVRIVMLTVSEADDQLVEAVRLGVHGYLLKNIHPKELFDQLRAVMRDEHPISPSLAGRLFAEVRNGTNGTNGRAVAEHGAALLSPRELETMRLVSEGLSNKEIGSRLSITEGTVKNHVHSALRKLGMDNRIQAAAYIVRQGLGKTQRD